jgi:hypothetical protein
MLHMLKHEFGYFLKATSIFKIFCRTRIKLLKPFTKKSDKFNYLCNKNVFAVSENLLKIDEKTEHRQFFLNTIDLGKLRAFALSCYIHHKSLKKHHSIESMS